MEKKRNRLEIIRDILIVINEKNGKVKPTHILYKANLSHILMTEILNELIQKNFIKEIRNKNSKSYAITDKGLDYLKQYSLIDNFTTFFGIDS